jgi:hypothetical protein
MHPLRLIVPRIVAALGAVAIVIGAIPGPARAGEANAPGRDPIEMRLVLTQSRFRVAEPIEIRLEFRNVSDTTVAFWLPPQGRPMIDLVLHIHGQDGEHVMIPVLRYSAYYAPADSDVVDLSPGERTALRLVLRSSWSRQLRKQGREVEGVERQVYDRWHCRRPEQYEESRKTGVFELGPEGVCFGAVGAYRVEAELDLSMFAGEIDSRRFFAGLLRSKPVTVILTAPPKKR